MPPKIKNPSAAPTGKVKVAVPVGHQTHDVLGKQAKVYPTQHVDVKAPQQNNAGWQLNDSVTAPAAPPSAAGPGAIHEVKPLDLPRVSCGKANDAPSHNAALGDNEPLSVAKSTDRPSTARVPDPDAV